MSSAAPQDLPPGRRPGDPQRRREWCVHCEDMTEQTATVLASVPRTRMCATELRCTTCGRYAV